MVMAIVKNPQGLDFSAFTTTRPTTAIMIVMIARTPKIAVYPATSLISSLAICPRDLPSRRTEQNSTTKSCTAPPSTPPSTIQSVPGK